MLPKENRADKKTINLLFKEGKPVFSPNLTFRFILTGKPLSPRISFIAPKSVAKLAVTRNLLRRRGYAALKTYIERFPAGLAGAFVFKRHQEDVLTLEDEIKKILDKIN
jgi:ribonuclease P protein component